MKAHLRSPVVSASGKVAGLASGYYARTSRQTGRVTVCRIVNPFDRHEPTPAQLEQRERFALIARQPRKTRRTADGTIPFNP